MKCEAIIYKGHSSRGYEIGVCGGEMELKGNIVSMASKGHLYEVPMKMYQCKSCKDIRIV